MEYLARCILSEDNTKDLVEILAKFDGCNCNLANYKGL